MLYLGREAKEQRYREEWPLHQDYVNTFGHDRLPNVLVGDVMALSVDLVDALLELGRRNQHWAHFDDTVGVWLSTLAGIRRRNALQVDQEWVEWMEVLRGDAFCKDGTLVVAHCPTW